MKKTILAVTVLFVICTFSTITYSESICKEDDVVKAVEEAAAILEKDGSSGMEKIKVFRFCDGNYVFVNDFNAKTLMHITPHLIGKELIALKDDTGKRFFADFTKVAQSSKINKNGIDYYNGSGWVEYRWPKPGEKVFLPKKSYIKGCLMGKDNVYVGAGIYKDK